MQRTAVVGMRDLESMGVQRVTPVPGECRDRLGTAFFDIASEELWAMGAVELVPQHRVTDSGQMYTNLVLAPRADLHAQHGTPRASGEDLPSRLGSSASARGYLHEHVQDAIGRLPTSERKADHPPVLLGFTSYDGQVGLAGEAPFEGHLQAPLRFRSTPADDHAAGLAIQTMRDAWRRLSIALSEDGGQGVAKPSGRRMHGKAGRLVDSQYVFVPIQLPEGSRRVRLIGPRPDEVDDLPFADSLPGLARTPIGPASTALYDTLRSGSRETTDAKL